MAWFHMETTNPGIGSYLEGWEDTIYILHSRAEDEILQTIHTCDNNTQVFMFEQLRSLLNNRWEFAEKVDKEHFYFTAIRHNNKENELLNIKVEDAVKAMIAHPDFHLREHNKEYEEEYKGVARYMMAGWNPYKTTRTVTHRKYYCIEFSTDFIDLTPLDRYIELVQRIIDSFRKIVLNHLTLYDAGKYVSSAEIIYQKEIIRIEQPEQKMLEVGAARNEVKKLKTTLTSGQLLYLFQSLKSIGVFPPNTTIADLCRFIEVNLSSRDRDDLKASNLVKDWSDIDINDIAFWYDKFPDMFKQSQKDNPNKIPYKDFGKK